MGLGPAGPDIPGWLEKKDEEVSNDTGNSN
jgi:hypothetical protein